MRVIWVAFGGAVFYLVAAVAIPAIVVILRQRGIEVTAARAAVATNIGAIWAAGLGGYLGWRHARTLEARRSEA